VAENRTQDNLPVEVDDTAADVAEREAALSYRLFTDYAGDRLGWEGFARKMEAFRNNVQLSSRQISLMRARGQAPLKMNQINRAIEQMRALVTQNRPQFRAAPREDSDVKVGRLYGGILDWVWDKSDGRLVLGRTTDDSLEKGLGAILVYQDMSRFHPEVRFQWCYPFDVYIDSNSRHPYGDDAAHIIWSRPFTVEELENQLPDFVEQIRAAEPETFNRYSNSGYTAQEGQRFIGDDASGGKFHQTVRLIERYSKVREPVYHVQEFWSLRNHEYTEEQYQEWRSAEVAVVETNGVERFSDNPDEVERTRALMSAYGEVVTHFSDGTMASGAVAGADPGVVAQVVKYALTDNAGLLKAGLAAVTVIPTVRIKMVASVGKSGYLYSRILPLEHYPIVLLMNRHFGTPFPLSDVFFALDAQKYLNKMYSLMISHMQASVNVKTWVPRGSTDIDELEKKWYKPIGLFPYNAEYGHPHFANPPQYPAELYHNIEAVKGEIMDIFGIPELMFGKASGAPNTAQGTAVVERYGQLKPSSKVAQIEMFLTRLGQVVADLVPHTYTYERVFRIMQPHGLTQELSVNQVEYDQYDSGLLRRINDLTTARVDIEIVAGSTLPTDRMRLEMIYLNAYKEGLIDDEEYLKKTEIFDVEAVMRRKSQRAQMMRAIEQLQEENKELKGDLQTARREAVHDRQRVEVEKFKTQLNAVKGRAELAGEMFDLRLGDVMKQIKSEMKNEGEVNPEASERVA